ncbi:OmpA family protein [Neptuniibacter halophilus]|uniref:OmpA family protein n=1 Tax=Neptuniibacter halophilus TaxID=651666 RepID=UPI002572B00D|nr:OmpA family protein [Neptuniibacter halophilus]
MINSIRLPAAALSLLLLGGCSGYSNLVNSMAPEKPEWEIALSDGGKIRRTEDGHECEPGEYTEMALPADPVPVEKPTSLVARLYFIFNTDQLTPESAREAQEVYTNILSRQTGDVIVVGHTDTMGSHSYNDSLSLRRAKKVRENLIDLGLEAERIKVSGMGERELLVETADSVNELRNRRVEINMR